MSGALQQHERANPWNASVQQRCFRRLMNAFAYPGTFEPLLDRADEEHSSHEAVLRLILATLIDGETTLADTGRMVGEDDWQKLDAARATSEHSQFIVARGDVSPDFEPCLGSLDNPHEGATLLLRVGRIGLGLSMQLTGPGVDGARDVAVEGLLPDWLVKRAEWTGTFPLGVDMVLFDAVGMVTLPRTTKVDWKEEARGLRRNQGWH